jgi:hypothetical protein
MDVFLNGSCSASECLSVTQKHSDDMIIQSSCKRACVRRQKKMQTICTMVFRAHGDKI